MAKMIIGFEEFGGVKEYCGLRVDIAEPLIINKAVDYLLDNMWKGIDDENYIYYELSEVNFGAREVVLHVKIKGV